MISLYDLCMHVLVVVCEHAFDTNQLSTQCCSPADAGFCLSANWSGSDGHVGMLRASWQIRPSPYSTADLHWLPYFAATSVPVPVFSRLCCPIWPGA